MMTYTTRIVRFGEPPTRGHVRPEPPTMSLDIEARLRVKQILGYLGISHSTLYAGIRNGRYPKPDGYDGRMPYWYSSTIKRFLFA